MAQEPRADLHMHSRYSDGMHTPEELVSMASRAGVRILALTDHDTIQGVDEIMELARASGLEVLPGVELSTHFDGCDLHLLGYLMSHREPGFRETLDSFREERQARAQRIVDRLRELDLDIDIETVRGEAGNAVLGRPHIARALVQRGEVEDVEEAFRKWIGPDRPGYVEKYKFDTRQAMELIQSAGGVAVLAHPGTARRPEVVEKLAAAGLDGLEVHHPKNTSEDKARFRSIAREHGLLMTGGSDFHGDPDRPGEAAIGAFGVDLDTVEEMRRRAGSG